MNDSLMKIYTKVKDVNMRYARDETRDCLIFDSNEDYKKFVEFAKNELNLSGETNRLEIERILHTDFYFSNENDKCNKCDNLITLRFIDYYENYKGEYICNSCFKNSFDAQLEYLEEVINDYTDSSVLLSDEFLEDRGFIKLDEKLLNELNLKKSDGRKEIFLNLQKKYSEIVFSVDNQDYFKSTFSVWVRDKIE